LIDSFFFISAAVSRLPESIRYIRPGGRRLLRLMFQLSDAPDFIFHGILGFLLGCLSFLNSTYKLHYVAKTEQKKNNKRRRQKNISSSTVHSTLFQLSFLISHFSLNCLATNLIKKFLHHFIPFLLFAPSRLCCFSSAY